eukprot:COSAG04_NODE_51_length_31064_cov_38.384789_16_plen_72_part_00
MRKGAEQRGAELARARQRGVELTALAQPKSSARCMMMLLRANARFEGLWRGGSSGGEGRDEAEPAEEEDED